MDSLEGGEISESVRESIFTDLRKAFRPEFLNRIDDSLIFKPLRLEEIEQIVGLLLKELTDRLLAREIELVVPDAVIEWIAEKGFDPVYGARPLKRFIQKHLETAIARRLISGEIAEGGVVEVGLGDEGLIVSTHSQAA